MKTSTDVFFTAELRIKHEGVVSGVYGSSVLYRSSVRLLLFYYGPALPDRRQDTQQAVRLSYFSDSLEKHSEKAT